MNQLYDKMWLFYNFFQPVMRLKEKELSPQEGSYKVKHRYDSAQTPLQRLCKTEAILSLAQDRGTREKLAALRDVTNPRQLRKEVYQLLDEVLTLAKQDTAPQPQTIAEQLLEQIQRTKKGELVPVTLSND